MTKAASALAFVLEVALIGAVVMWAVDVWALEPLLAVAVAGVPAAILTAVFMTSTSKLRLSWPARPLVAHALFVAGAAVLIGLGYLSYGWIFLVLALVSAALTWRLRATLGGPEPERRRATAASETGAASPRPQPTGRRAAR